MDLIHDLDKVHQPTANRKGGHISLRPYASSADRMMQPTS